MSEPMLRLGAYTFSLNTAAYQEFSRTSEWVWAALQRLGQDDALQSTGNGPDTIRLSGVIYPEHRGGTGQMDAMRALGAQRIPQALIDGRGRMLGSWVITRLDERGGIFAQRGVARRQEFEMELRRAPDDAAGAVGIVASIVVSAPVTSALGLGQAAAATAAKGPASMLSSLTGSLSTLSGMAAQLGSQANTVLGAVRTGMNAAKTLHNAGTDAGKLLASAQQLANLPSAMNGLVSTAGSVSRAAGQASGLLSQASGAITDNAAVRAVQDAMISTNKLNVLAVKVHSDATAATEGT